MNGLVLLLVVLAGTSFGWVAGYILGRAAGWFG